VVVDGELSGFLVGITADRRWEEQAELLRRRGANVLHGPSIRTLPMDGSDELRSVTEELILDPPSHLLANTGLGIRSWFAAAESWGIGDAMIGAFAEAHIVARGPKASAAVHQLGLEVAGRAMSERLSEAIALLIASGIDGARIAFQRHGDESPEVVEQLTAAGAQVIEVPVYRWTLPDDDGPALRLINATIAERVDAVTFTSAPALRNMFQIAAARDLDEPLRRAFASSVIAACVGPVCLEAAQDLKVELAVMPDRFRIGPLIRRLAEELTASTERIELSGQRFLLRGSGLVTDDGVIGLSARELGVLRHLIARRPAVVSKAELLREAWPQEAADTHAVEVTIARLRKRLGPLGGCIVSMSKRGYAVT
jgi:uroporphyrinogen-III synthase